MAEGGNGFDKKGEKKIPTWTSDIRAGIVLSCGGMCMTAVPV